MSTRSQAPFPSRGKFYPRRRALLKGGAVGGGALLLAPLHGLLAQDIRYANATGAVHTTAGQVSGARFGNLVDAYYGIPYAQDTAASGRFMAPRPPLPWSGVREATAIGDRCPQRIGFEGLLSEIFALDREEAMSENCLMLNVFTPAADSGRRPVLVWLHGGGFTSGSGGWILYDGGSLAHSQDVVVVTVNHRLNVFGHLHLADIGGEQYADAGNAGLLDLIAALQWVQDNIENFGGNPDSVTVFGQSGGAGKASTLMAMPAARGLFHKVIAMSGSYLTGISPDQATETALRFMAALGLQEDQADRLPELPMEQLLNAYLEIPGMNLGPVLDGAHLPRHPFSPDAPAQSSEIPMMLGSTEHETVFFPGAPLEEMDAEELLERVMENTGAGADEAKDLIAVYRRGRPDVSNVKLYHVIASDNSFRRGILAEAELKADQRAAPVYMYYFSWQSRVRGGRLGAYHCIDIPFAFNNVDACASMLGAGADRYLLASRLSGAFAAFARTGDPSHELLPQWMAFDREQRATMRMDAEPELLLDPDGDERRALYALS